MKAPEVKAPEATEFLAMLAEEEQDLVLVVVDVDVDDTVV